MIVLDTGKMSIRISWKIITHISTYRRDRVFGVKQKGAEIVAAAIVPQRRFVKSYCYTGYRYYL